MNEIWKYFDLEYGKPNVLSKECIDYLHNLQYSKAATSESAKFNKLYRCWSTVYSDLSKVGQLEALNHAPTLQKFLSKLPSKASGRRYITMAKDLRIKKKTELEIIHYFVTDEREMQKEL